MEILTDFYRLEVKSLNAVQRIISDSCQHTRLLNTGTHWHSVYKTSARAFRNHLMHLRQPGQGDTAETEVRDLRAELLRAEAAHFTKKNGNKEVSADNGDQLRIEAPSAAASASTKRSLENNAKGGTASGTVDGMEEDLEAKRRRLILEEAREIDADSERSDSDSSDEYVEKSISLGKDVIGIQKGTLTYMRVQR